MKELKRRRQRRFGDAAYSILKEKNRPMAYTEIIEIALETHLKTNGKTPAQSLRVAMHRDDRFVKVGKGTYSLSEWK